MLEKAMANTPLTSTDADASQNMQQRQMSHSESAHLACWHEHRGVCIYNFRSATGGVDRFMPAVTQDKVFFATGG